MTSVLFILFLVFQLTLLVTFVMQADTMNIQWRCTLVFSFFCFLLPSTDSSSRSLICGASWSRSSILSQNVSLFYLYARDSKIISVWVRPLSLNSVPSRLADFNQLEMTQESKSEQICKETSRIKAQMWCVKRLASGSVSSRYGEKDGTTLFQVWLTTDLIWPLDLISILYLKKKHSRCWNDMFCFIF